ncbi:MAG: N-acetyl-gamma-glutamyl-phosphate reductase [Desulfobacterales bacterium]|jgi:N-acetyl-gamma-glutamyl-phosphate reductase
MVRIAVVGATGYAGAELVRILIGHPDVSLTTVTSRKFAGQPFASIYPALSGLTDLSCEPYDVQGLKKSADMVFLSLPHQLPMNLVPELLEAGLRVIDLSADFRFSDVHRYETVYQPHAAPALLDQAVYGLSEIYADRIRASRLVGNPGCYPTSVLLPLIPLIRDGLISPAHLVADAKSGVSGAGRSLSLATHFCEVSESFKPYKVAQHRHNPEIDEVISREAGYAVHLTFVPHLLPMSRGMLATTYAQTTPLVESDRIMECLKDSYGTCPFVRLSREGHVPNTRHVRGTNFIDIGLHLDDRSGTLILMSAIDNLVKGAAGQAVQNMNLMLDLDERAGLMPVPYPL